MKVFEDLRLSDVTELATSADYRDRFLGEYLETKIRYEKLHKMLIKAEAGKLTSRRRARSASWSRRRAAWEIIFMRSKFVLSTRTLILLSLSSLH